MKPLSIEAFKKAKKQPRKHIESGRQKVCVRYYRLKYPDNIIIAIPNGGRRGKIEAAIMKGEGVLAGFPDLMIISPNGVQFIEMKAEDGTLSKTQKEVHERLKKLGYSVDVCRNLDEFIQAVEV